MAGRLFQNYLLTWQSPSAGQFIRCLIPNIESFANQTSKLPKIESFAHRTSKLPIIESFAHRTSNCSRIEHRKCRKMEEYYRTSKFAHRTSNAHPDRSIRNLQRGCACAHTSCARCVCELLVVQLSECSCLFYGMES